MKTRSVCLVSLILAQWAFGQAEQGSKTAGDAWKVPFASEGNTISLSIQNNSRLEAKGVNVTFRELPAWVKFNSSTATIKSIPANGAADAEYTFSVDRKAPVGRDTGLVATITTADGQSWSKEIRISVDPPKNYKLYDNFPNPFNPSTKIAFELPRASRVRVVVYDIVGREVARVADANYPAGYTELTWNGITRNGSLASSGIYFCAATSDKWRAVRKMMLMK